MLFQILSATNATLTEDQLKEIEEILDRKGEP